MGIDVYMNWEHQTNKEKKEQITGFDITMGRVGCLRASYSGSMLKECDLLYSIFGKKVQNGKKHKFDFIKNEDKAINILKKYLKEFQHEDAQCFKWRIAWANSVFDFFYLGIIKQRKKFKPTVKFSG